MMAYLRYWASGNPGERGLADTLLTPAEIHNVLLNLRGTCRLVGELLFETGLKLEDALALRVRDVDLDQARLAIRGGGDEVARRIPLSEPLRAALAHHLQTVRAVHARDLAQSDFGAAMRPDLAAQYPFAARRWCWQWLFPSGEVRRVADGHTRLPLGATVVCRAFADAGRHARVMTSVHPQAFRHAFTARLLAGGASLEALRACLGHANPATTERYVQVLQEAIDARGRRAGHPSRADRRAAAPMPLAPSEPWGELAAMCAG